MRLAERQWRVRRFRVFDAGTPSRDRNGIVTRVRQRSAIFAHDMRTGDSSPTEAPQAASVRCASGGLMRVLIATDAWHPQVNGIVRTLGSLADNARRLGVAIEFLTPDGFPSLPVPTYPGLRCAVPNPREIARRIAQARPDAIHLATEGPIGHAVRRYCVKRGLPFTTSYTTRFPEYISARLPIPEAWSHAGLPRFQ